MHLVTFMFVSIELVLLFYLIIHSLARPDDRIARLNIILILLLLIYNITGGLLPDPKLPGSYFIQEVIAYATGFITPCYFPYYVYKAFGLHQLRFHAYRGVLFFLGLPYLIFVGVFGITGNLHVAQDLLILPVLYAVWVVASLISAIRKKYSCNFEDKKTLAEITALLSSVAPWLCLPAVTYFDLGQPVEVLTTNFGFLMLFGLQAKRNIQIARTEHERLLRSEKLLQRWNTDLCEQVRIRTEQLEKVNEQRTNNFINLVHEIKTPLTLVKNYLDEYIGHHNNSRELFIIKGGVDKLIADVANLFDLQRFIKGIAVYNHNQVSDFSNILRKNIIFFEHYSSRRGIRYEIDIDENVYVKADPLAINRIINNVVENAVKFSIERGVVKISLHGVGNKVLFIVEDNGIGIDPEKQKRIFEPYFQISQKTTALQGMGLGLPIVKRIIDNLRGSIDVHSTFTLTKGTKVTVALDWHDEQESDEIHRKSVKFNSTVYDLFDYNLHDNPYDEHKKSIFLIEDSKAMLYYLSIKLTDNYNIYYAYNGVEALKKLGGFPTTPDIVLLDIMMDKMDGFSFAKIISNQARYSHIPIIFLTARSAPDDKLKGLQLGAIDYISKPFSFEQLKYKIENILNNIERNYQSITFNSFFSRGCFRNVETGTYLCHLDFSQKCRLYGLTHRETEISDLLKQGKSYKLIAKTLFISEKTVGKHIEHIFEKMGTSNKMELINKLLL